MNSRLDCIIVVTFITLVLLMCAAICVELYWLARDARQQARRLNRRRR